MLIGMHSVLKIEVSHGSDTNATLQR
jgi:hypothetical protein